jgi:indole-3-glycerol phosphate synthase
MLDEILGDKRREVEHLYAQASAKSFAALIANNPPVRDFRAAIHAIPGIAIIAEIKRKSPSRGILNVAVDAGQTAILYQQAGASAVSVLTDEKYFGGSLDDLRTVRQVVDLPILRKDFIIDELQLLQSRASGADAVLLIVAALTCEKLATLHQKATELGLSSLVEIHTEAEAHLALDIGAELIGINNRDLRTFDISLDVTSRIAPLLPTNVTIVSESGIHTAADVALVQKAGARAVLVGQSLMTSSDLAAKLRELMGSSR